MQYTLEQIRQAGKDAELKDSVAEHLISMLPNPEEEKKPSPEQRFIEIIKGLVIDKDEEYSNSTFYFKDEKYFFELEKDTLWCSYDNVWSIFYKEYQMDYYSVQAFLRNQVEEHFKMKGVTPSSSAR
jgi:hypothetical protein